MANNIKVVQNPDSISYLNQREAAEVDEILMGPLGFSVDQLMVSGFRVHLLSGIQIFVMLQHNMANEIRATPRHNGSLCPLSSLQLQRDCQRVALNMVTIENYFCYVFVDISYLQELAGLSVATAIAEVSYGVIT